MAAAGHNQVRTSRRAPQAPTMVVAEEGKNTTTRPAVVRELPLRPQQLIPPPVPRQQLPQQVVHPQQQQQAAAEPSRFEEVRTVLLD
jgi:hypothetical protein